MAERSTDSCAACGVRNVELSTCGRCNSTAYCGRECQSSHWKEHKLVCDVAKMNLESSGADQNATAKEAAARSHSKIFRKMKKENMPIVSVSMTAFGMVAPGLPIPDGVPKNFALKQEATVEFQTGPATRPDARGNLKGEGTYRAYYEDLVEDRTKWMSFFDHRDNYQHAEHTCGILGTLATIYRQRGVLQDCEDVLDMEAEVMERYKRSSIGGPAAQIYCCEALEYKMNHIRYNMCFQRKHFKKCVPLFRILSEYERSHDLDFDQQQYLFMTVAILNKPPTKHTLRSLSDAEVMKMVKAPLQNAGGVAGALEVEKAKERVALKKCGPCGRSEKFMDEFKTCPRCNSAIYCGRECQKKDWKAHKKVCNKD